MLRLLEAKHLVNVAGGTPTTTTKQSSFELHFTCESVEFTNIK